MRPRLQQSEAEVTRLQAEVSRLQAQLDATASLRARAGRGGSRRRAAPNATAAPAGSSAPPPTAPPRRIWPWALRRQRSSGLLVGFALGWRMLDRSIRSKYGGLKIY